MWILFSNTGSKKGGASVPYFPTLIPLLHNFGEGGGDDNLEATEGFTLILNVPITLVSKGHRQEKQEKKIVLASNLDQILCHTLNGLSWGLIMKKKLKSLHNGIALSHSQ